VTYVDPDTLEKGNFYLFYKTYEEYRPDIIIGAFEEYDRDDVPCRTAILNNVLSWVVGHNFSIAHSIGKKDQRFCELSAPHSTVWCFELDKSEVECHILMEML